MIPSSYDIFFECLKSKSDILGRFEAESINVFFGLISLNLNLRDFYLFFGDQIKNNRLIESSLKIEENWKRFRKGDNTYFSRRGRSIYFIFFFKFSINVRLTESNLKIESISRKTIYIP